MNDSSLPIRPGRRSNARRPGRSRRLAAGTAAGLALTLTACSGGGPGASALDEDAAWAQVALPDSARLAGERVDFTADLGAIGDLPRLIAGVGAEPGDPDAARVWTEKPDGTGWNWSELSLPEADESSVGFAVTDGASTWVGGSSWTAGEATVPYVQVSADRVSWEDVALPEEAADRSVRAGGAVAVDGHLLVVGVDAAEEPVAVVAGEDGALVDLPSAPEGREFRGFAGVAAAGDTVVAVGLAGAAGQADETVVYRSVDGGSTWTVAVGPAQGPAAAYGIAAMTGGFVVTGALYGGDGVARAAAWASADGTAWAAETLPALDGDRYGIVPRERDHTWLGAPSATGDRLVAALSATNALRFAVVQRDAAGVWRVLGTSNNWLLQGSGALAALDEDGTVLLAQSMRNVARAGELTTSGVWSAHHTTEFGTDDAGLDWSTFLDQAGTPALVGRRVVVETTLNGAWTQTGELAGYAIGEDGTAVDRPWDPAETASLSQLYAASDPSGASVAMGSVVIGGQKANIIGWSRASAGAPWTPVQGFDTPSTEGLSEVARLAGTWVGVGATRASFTSSDPESAAVWTSTDGVTWTAAQGAFASTAGGETGATGVCALPGGELLVVGYADEGAQQHPLAWRYTGGQWQRLDAAVFGSGFGQLTSCATDGDTTVVQGTRDGQETLWRTSDGATFTADVLGERGETFGRIRVVDGGFAAAGTRTADGQQGAVVWLSADATSWRAVPVPADRVLTGADVMPSGSGLLLAANSESAPELWSLADVATLIAGS